MTRKLAVLPLFLMLAAWPSCGGNVPTPTPNPAPSDIPVGADPCALEAEHLRALGCPEWDSTYEVRCKALDRHLREEHQQVADHTCPIHAPSCPAARACQ